MVCRFHFDGLALGRKTSLTTELPALLQHHSRMTTIAERVPSKKSLRAYFARHSRLSRSRFHAVS